MALLDSITQAQKMGAQSSDILKQIMVQNPNASIAKSIQDAMTKGAQPDAVLQEIVKQNTAQVAPEKSGIIGSEQNFGQSIADALSSGKATKEVTSNMQSHSQQIQQLVDLEKQMTSEGKDTSHVKMLISTMMNEDPSKYGGKLSDLIPSVNKTPEQIIGEASGVATDLLTAGSALSPTVAGAAFGLTHALQQDKGVGGSLVDTAIGALGGKILEYGFGKVSPFIEKAVSTYGAPLLDKLAQYIPKGAMDALQKLADKATIGVGQGGSDAINKVNEVIQKPFDAASDFVNKAKNKILGTPEEIAAKKSAKDTNAVAEIISPKITSAETQNAINEGRVTRGSDSAVFGKAPDVVAHSEQIMRSADVISQEIPNAAKMNDVQINSSIDKWISDTSEKLKPEMAKTPVSSETVDKVTSTWEDLKSKQASTPEFLDNKAGNEAFQNKFENYLNQSKNAKDLNEVWDVRKAYDDSIPKNVKNATTNSSPVLQDRQAMWLQNRAILNSTIHDVSTGLGETSRDAFSKMSDMYEAKQNILQKAKLDLKGKEGILPRNAEQWKKRAIQALKVGGLYELGRKVFTGSF